MGSMERGVMTEADMKRLRVLGAAPVFGAVPGSRGEGAPPGAPPLRVVEAPDWFGELSHLTHSRRSATVTAVGDITVWRVARGGLHPGPGRAPPPAPRRA